MNDWLGCFMDCLTDRNRRLYYLGMTNKELEELIYEYGETLKHIGRCETDGKTNMKEYNKLISQKEKIVEKFDKYFKNDSKLKKALNL